MSRPTNLISAYTIRLPLDSGRGRLSSCYQITCRIRELVALCSRRFTHERTFQERLAEAVQRFKEAGALQHSGSHAQELLLPRARQLRLHLNQRVTHVSWTAGSA